METKYLRTPSASVQSLGEFRSYPAEMTLTGPIEQAVSSHREHPQEMTVTAVPVLAPLQSIHLSMPEK